MAEECRYLIKRVREGQSVAMQSHNGPCPLLALCNCLFLSQRADPPAGIQWANTQQLASIVAEVLLARGQQSPSDANLQQTLSDAIALLPSLEKGLDVNVGFSGPSQFEFTPQIALFDLCGVRLFHCWAIDPQDPRTPTIQKLKYNDAVVRAKDDTVIQTWLEETGGVQCTSYGLICVAEQLRESELAVLFRSSHFSVIHKHQGRVFNLVTDVGYSDSEVVWESVDGIDGDSSFFTAKFAPFVSEEEKKQKKALKNDHQLAIQLQRAEEDRASIKKHHHSQEDDCTLF